MEIINNSSIEPVETSSSFCEQTALWCKDKVYYAAKTSYLFLRSPLLWTFGSLLGSATILSPIVAVCLLGVVCGSMVKWPEHIPKAILYEGAMVDNIVCDFFTRNRLMNRPYCSHITNGIYLSGLPIKNSFDYDKCKPKAVLAVVEDFELTTETFLSAPLSREDWKELGVSHYKHLPIEDLQVISAELLDQAADFINTHKEGIVVHCKAGRGRSAMCVIAYLIKYEQYGLTKALEYIKEKRPHISINSWQLDCLQEYQNYLKTNLVNS